MLILFVCTGNICRSPIGELLAKRYLAASSINIASAGTHGLSNHPIDPSSEQLLSRAGIDSQAFRSKRLTAELAASADLIFCFERIQRQEIALLAPAMSKRIFLLGDFANIATYCSQNNMVYGLTVAERLESVIAAAPLIQGLLPRADDIEDPHRQSFDAFERAADETNKELRTILLSLKKHPLAAPELHTAQFM
ncbi:MAG: low molecular weight phosphatase family protein [Bifidobacterium crudilactis]|jgi:protein-tyrosine phosphatase